MTDSYERGTSPLRLEWIQESSIGVVPSNPSWNLFSDNIASAWDWEPDANTQRQSGAGDIEAQGYFNGAETHEASFEYHLQQWYVDGSSNTVDPGGDFLRPSSDNYVRNTHAVVSRSEVDNGGVDSSGIRTYTVGKGGYPSSISVPFETEDGSPINQTLEYQFEKIRRYHIDQPADSTTITVVSSNANDSGSVTIENEGASTTETVTITANGSTTTTASFSDIDAVELDSEQPGDIDIEDDSGNVLLTILGQNSYPHGEGDLGVPALGTGSHASALNSSYIRFLDDSITLPNAPSGSFEFISGELSADTGLDDTTTTGGPRRNIHPTEFSYTFTATLAGDKVGVDQVNDYLTEQTGTITWDAGSDGSIDGSNAFIQSPGTYTKEAGNGKIQYDNEFTAESLTLNT